MSNENSDKNMQTVKGGIFAQADIDLLKKSLDFYIKNNKSLDTKEQSKISLLFHRLGRMSSS
ncbi:MAG: hypothetical protein VXW97_02960 [Pseudomonadota bacterium]|nr:hypothetical protein [Pseudomonadota bacterium]